MRAGGPEAVLTQLSPEDRCLAIEPVPPRNHNDWSSLDPERPAILFRPRTTEEVSRLLAACHAHGVPVVPQGGLTGLSGGARPIAGAVALSLERMSGVIELDEASATITVWAGTPLETVQTAAAEAGLQFALDLGARGSCAIGGNVSTNAGGNRVIRYGMARELVLGMEVVLPDGTVVASLNKMLKNNTGYDIRQIFVGAEGTLGVITRLVLRLHPLPACTHAALAGLGDYDAALRLLAGARRRLGPSLSAFEVMWPDYWTLATGIDGVRDPLSGTHGLYVLIESQGTDEEIDGPRFERFLEAMLEDGVIEDAAMARSLSDVRSFWATRDVAAEFKSVLGPHLAFDVGLPVGAIDAYVRACRERLTAEVPGCRSVYYGHIGDGNLHLLAWVPGAEEQPAEGICAVVYDLVRRHDGSVSAEHGIGLTKKAYLPFSRSPEEIELMRVLKRAIDPRNILNPGKILDVA